MLISEVARLSLTVEMIKKIKKNTIGDGGTTALCTAYTVYSVYIIQTALHCFNTSMHAHIYCKVKMLLEWADKLLSKMWD